MSDYDPFAADYDIWADHMTADIAWYVELARRAEEPVVELAVGSGRVAIPIARETGKRVIGIDRSPAMLELRSGDMRDFVLEEPVELLICPFRSLLHLPTWEDKRRVFVRVAAALEPGGRFAWNAFVFSPFIAAANHDQKRFLGDTEHWELVRHAPGDNRVDVVRGRGKQTTGTLRLWWSTKSEWEGLLEAAGLETEELYGGFDREPFTDDSLEFVWVARKQQ
jgi:hypothetical protein